MTYAREHFAELCERAHFRDETIVIKKGKSDRVALIPVKSLEILEMVEQVIDRMRSERALHAVREGEATVSLEDLQRELSIEVTHTSKSCR
jgi:PHD/YefM family antitoxin component YafN of YafNO toxin-antitoxin module